MRLRRLPPGVLAAVIALTIVAALIYAGNRPGRTRPATRIQTRDTGDAPIRTMTPSPNTDLVVFFMCNGPDAIYGQNGSVRATIIPNDTNCTR